MKKALLIALGVFFLFAGTSFAFHDAGVAYCAGCHTMHNSADGQPVDPDHLNGNGYLLKYATPSDVCLSCHATRHGAVFGSDPLNPPPEIGGGNFVFLLEDNLNDGHAGGAVDSLGELTNPIPGDAAGHSIVAPSMNVSADATLSTAPGGSFPASALGCSSCHDPHGNDNFRMLYGAGQTVQVNKATFLNDAPEAVGLSTSSVESNSNHTAYISGMSAWCGNCHGDFHANTGKLIHKSGFAMGQDIADVYGAYNGTVQYATGTPATSYLAAVPFEDAAMTTSYTGAPNAGSQVMCLTCHRAHASSAANAGRWDFQVTLLEEDGVESGSYAIPDPYNSPYQRSLCNKCHKKDAYDENSAP